MDNLRKEYNTWLVQLSNNEIQNLCEESAWLAWQASREALVVQLPAAFDSSKEDASHYEYAYLQSEVEESLDAAGVSYK